MRMVGVPMLIAGVEVKRLSTGAHQWNCAHEKVVNAFWAGDRLVPFASCGECPDEALRGVLDGIEASSENAHSGGDQPTERETSASSGIESRAVAEEKTLPEGTPGEHRTPHDRDSESASQQAGASPARPTKEKAPPGEGRAFSDVAVKRGVLHPHNGNGHGTKQAPPVDSWKLALYDRAHHACETLLKKGGGMPAFLATEPLDSFIATVNQHRNINGDTLTHDPELTPVEIDEEIQVIARALQEDYQVPAISNGHAPAVNGTSSQPAIHPDDVLQPLNLGQLYDLCDEWDRQPWVWDGILPRSSLSLIVGKSETGKSTLIYALIYAIIRGLIFLGRRCEEGRVLYLAGDPMSEVVAGKTFRSLDLGREDGVMVLPGAMVNNPSAMLQLKNIVADFKPALIVGDTLAATVALDTDKYGQSYSSQQPLSKLARESGANFLMAHHSQKAAVDSYNVVDAALGSVGVAAVASTRMVTRLYRRGKDKFHTFEMSNLRIGQPIEGEWIVRKLENGLIELGSPWGQRSIELDREAIMVALDAQRDWVSGRTLFQEVTPKPKYGQFMKALREMVKAGLVEDNKKKGQGGGWVYRKSTSAPVQEKLHDGNRD